MLGASRASIQHDTAKCRSECQVKRFGVGGVRGGVRFMQLWIGTDTRLLTENPQRSARSPLETRTDGDTEMM